MSVILMKTFLTQEMAQGMKVLATEPNDLSLLSMVEGGNKLMGIVL